MLDAQPIPQPAMCPCCGFNLKADAPVSVGEWHLRPDMAELRGRRLHLTPAETIFLHSLATNGGRPMRREAIGRRIGDAFEPANVASVIACRLRKKLPEVPFETVHEFGYRWSVA